MANVRLGPIVADARGSVGDVIFTRTIGGLTAKSKSSKVPTDTLVRAAVRTALTLVAQGWRDVLTNDQRQQWRDYGGRHPLPDCWGVANLIDGYYQYTRANFPWAREDGTIHFRVPPATGPLPAPIISVNVSPPDQRLYLNFTLPAYVPRDWAGSVWMYTGDVTSQAVRYYQSPFTYARRFRIDNPWIDWVDLFTYPHSFTSGQLLHLRVVAQRDDDGRISLPATIAVAT